MVVRLVDVATDRHIWGDSFDGPLSDPFELQDRVVDGVLCGVVSRITDAEIERAHAKDPRDLGARDLAMQALPLILGANAASARKAVAILNRAVARDPADAVAAALLSFTQIELVGRYATESPGAALSAAVQLSQRASFLDNNDPLVLVARSGVAGWLKQYDEADALLKSSAGHRSHQCMGLGALRICPAFQPACRSCRRGPGPRRICPTFSVRRRRSRRCRFPAIASAQEGPGFPGATASMGSLQHTVWPVAGRTRGFGCARRLQKIPMEPGSIGTCHVSHSRWATGVASPNSVDSMRRAHPYLTVAYHAVNFPVMDPRWLEALASAGMPLG